MNNSLPSVLNLDTIYHLEQKKQEATDRILRERGWEYTCATPSSYWMWVKDIPGFQPVAFYRAEDALSMEGRIQEVEVEKPNVPEYLIIGTVSKRLDRATGETHVSINLHEGRNLEDYVHEFVYVTNPETRR